MTEDKQAAVNIPEGESAPEGYVHVFGPLWISKTALKPAEEVKKAFSKIDFTNPSCESAMAAMKSISSAVQSAVAMPKQLIDQAQGLLRAATNIVEMPFSAVKEAMDSAMSNLDEINSAINGLMSNASDAKNALMKALECPLLAGSPLGNAIEDVLDAMDSGSGLDDSLDKLKKQLGSQVQEQLDALSETPLQALSNMQDLLDDIMDRYDVNGVMKQLQGIEACVSSACNAADVASRLPESSEKILSSINGKLDTATGKIKSAIFNPKTTAQQAVSGTMKKISEITGKVESPIYINM